MKTIIELTPSDIDVAIRMFLEKYHNSNVKLENFEFEYRPEKPGFAMPFNQTSLVLVDKYPDIKG